jgi:molybdopterin molybdotransferase
MRARLTPEGLVPDARQDSALLSVLAGSGALLVRPPHAPAARAGEIADYLPL